MKTVLIVFLLGLAGISGVTLAESHEADLEVRQLDERIPYLQTPNLSELRESLVARRH